MESIMSSQSMRSLIWGYARGELLKRWKEVKSY